MLRGVIHYHSPQFTNAEYKAPISEVMGCTQDAAVSVGEQLNAKLDDHYNLLLDWINGTASRVEFIKTFPHLPSNVTNNSRARSTDTILSSRQIMPRLHQPGSMAWGLSKPHSSVVPRICNLSCTVGMALVQCTPVMHQGIG
jgi:hypothetical protein